MTTVYILEAQLVDHPQYETFVDVFLYKSAAIQEAIDIIKQTMVEDGIEGDVVVKRISDTQHVVTDNELSKYYITQREVKERPTSDK